MNDFMRPIPLEPVYGPKGQRATASISCGFEQLLWRHGNSPKHYDVVIVGSGYGAAIAAAELAGCTDEGNGRISVCVLERGSEYLAGTFPARMSELPGHIRFSMPSSPQPFGVREGLFDLRLGGDVNALVANGLGGGSLINAGVMAIPADEVFQSAGWPQAFRDVEQRKYWYDKGKKLLGASVSIPGAREDRRKIVDNTIELHREGPSAKFRALQSLAGHRDTPKAVFTAAPLSMAMTTGDTSGDVPFGTCNRCGDCVTGCNQGAKNSLDTNLLAKASSRGAEIYTGATVLRILRAESSDGWCLEVVHTDDKLRKRQGEPLTLSARKVILAAGAFGSTEILLRSNSAELPLSPRLGQGFSSNGDMIVALYAQKAEVNAVADEAIPFGRRDVGPTISGMLKARSPDGRDLVIEELAIPGALKRVFEEVVTTAFVLHTLGKPDGDHHSTADRDPCAIDPEAIRRTSLFAVMGHDGANGSIELVSGGDESNGDGAVRVRWPELRNHPLFEDQLQVLQELATESGAGGTVLPNPMWQFVPKSLHALFDDKRGPMFTMHPLGGCAIGDDSRRGVVDAFGRVFDAASGVERENRNRAAWPNLVVLDGAIVPTSLGINPALTIAALALHAITNLRKAWNFAPPAGSQEASGTAHVLGAGSATQTAPVRATEFELIERMHGFASLLTPTGAEERCAVELTLKFKPFPLAFLTGRDKQKLALDERCAFSGKRTGAGRGDWDTPKSVSRHSRGSPRRFRAA